MVLLLSLFQKRRKLLLLGNT
ncbi:hypothetical protein ACHAXR_006490 [Thalassiosira sp. AJA248-18]